MASQVSHPDSRSIVCNSSGSEVVEAGNMAYQWTTYTLEAEDVSDVGKMIEVFNRQADGSWKVHRTIFNSDNPE